MTAMETIELEEWRRRATELGGGDIKHCPFVCPNCGNVATPQDFIAAGGKGASAPQSCIGRVTGGESGMRKSADGAQRPCDWAAFGLFGTLGRGVFVKMPDGELVDTFAFGTR